MRNKRKFVYVLIVAMFFVLVSCAAANPIEVEGVSLEATRSSRFICYQGGQKIIDTETLNGVTLDRESFGNGWSILSWKWEDELGKHYFPQEGTLCEEVRH